MCWYFFRSFQMLTGGSSICVHRGGRDGSTGLIAPRDSSQAGGLSRLATLLPLNARSVYGEGISKPAQATAGGQFSATCSNTASSQACAQTPFIYSSMLFLKRNKETVKTQRNFKKRGKRSIDRKMLLAHSH